MKIIEGILYLTISDAETCGLGDANYIYKEKSRGAKWATFIKDNNYQNQVLIEFESLHPLKKEKVIAHFGNPYEHFAKDPIRKMVVKDVDAEKFYFNYRFNEDKALPEETINKYTTAASWLKMLIAAQDDFKAIKKLIGVPASKFWLDVCDLIKSDNINLPSYYSELLKKIKLYRASGYSSLIHKQFGNTNAQKIDDEVCEAVLLKLISMPNSDDVVTARRYNRWAIENSKEQITSRTVTNWKLEHKHIITPEKHGLKVNYNEFGKHIQRMRPSAPLVLVENDDNELDLYFQGRRKNNKNQTEVYYFNRFVVAVVIDAYNDYILGWAIAPTYTKELIRFAYLDAVHHIKELTGNWYLPNQIRCDHFGLDPKLKNDLAQFYQSLAILTPATVKVARGKYIERSFGKQWHQALGCYPNYAGTNVTSSTGKVPQEFIEANKKDFPQTEQAPEQVAHFINMLRHLIDDKTGLSKQEQWVKAFNESEKSKKNLITEEQMLLKLGTAHTHQNKITNRGITPAINCEERTYDIPEHLYLQTIGRTVTVVYDVMDYSRILITDGDKLRFIARQIELMPSAIADFKPGDRQRLNDRLREKQRHLQTVSDAKDNINNILDRNSINAQSLIMAGVHTKAENHGALIEYTGSITSVPKRLTQKKNDKLEDIDDILNEM